MVAIKKVKKVGMETIGYLSQNKKRWGCKSCGIFHESDADKWFAKKNSKEPKSDYYYMKVLM